MVKVYSKAAKKFYNSKAWKGFRKYFMSTIPGQICQHCGREPGVHVDHIKEIDEHALATYDTDILLNPANSQLLCIKCHNIKTHRQSAILDDTCGFDEHGNFVQFKS